MSPSFPSSPLGLVARCSKLVFSNGTGREVIDRLPTVWSMTQKQTMVYLTLN